MPITLSPSDWSLPEDFNAPAIPGFHIPREFYWVKADHPPLAGMQLPSRHTPWPELHRAGFHWVVCLCSDHPLYDPSPLQMLYTLELSDLVETELPEDPGMEERAIRILAKKVSERLNNGDGVVIHCAGGRGRTGTLLGSVLVRNGWPPDQVVAYLDAIHRARGKAGWPESPWQKRVVEGCRPPESTQEPE